MIVNKNSLAQIWITSGDPFGIGPYIVSKSLSFFNASDLLIFGTRFFYEKIFQEISFKLPVQFISKLSSFNSNYYNIFEVPFQDEFKIQEEELLGGFLSYQYLTKAITLIKDLEIKPVLITGPVSKKRIQFFKKDFYGHSEFLEEHFQRNVSMLMWSKTMKLALVTRHIPLKEVSKALSEKKIIDTSIQSITFIKSIKKEPLNIRICALNPHAGESGTLGCEEDTIINPAINFLKNKFQEDTITGPLAADTAFFQSDKTDLIVSMYHDQGLIPFKTCNFFEGFQLSLGLPILRISVDHGTAFNLVDKKTDISFQSMFNSIEFAFYFLKEKISNI